MAIEKIAPPNLPMAEATFTARFFEQFTNILRLFFTRLVQQQNQLTENTQYIYSGAGSPEGAVEAPPGSLYSNTSGGAGTTLYVKESGTGDTGWVAK